MSAICLPDSNSAPIHHSPILIIEFNTAKRTALRDAGRAFRVKATATRSHHEAKPRQENGLAQSHLRFELLLSRRVGQL